MKIDIIATIGPASNSRQTIRKMTEAGMTIARINTKHADEKQCNEIYNNIQGSGCRVLYDIKNLKVLDFIKEQKFDYLAVSFAENVTQIRNIRKIIGKGVKIISKIETMRGVRNIDGLIKESDGIMVARGDLGKNVTLEKVPILQKIIIRKCNMKRKMAITATEMLLSMTSSKVPERAEVSDVANAVLDGSNALMLSEETAIGKHPVLTVKTMNKIINETRKMSRLLH